MSNVPTYPRGPWVPLPEYHNSCSWQRPIKFKLFGLILKQMEINRVSLVLLQAPLLTLHVAGVRHSATLNLSFFIWGNRVPSYNRKGGEREMEWQMWECFVSNKTSVTPLHSGVFLWSSDWDFQLPSACFHVVVSQVAHICMFKTDSRVPTHSEILLSPPTIICLIP